MNLDKLALNRIKGISKTVRLACYFLAALTLLLSFWSGGLQLFNINPDMSVQYLTMPGEGEPHDIEEFDAMLTWPLVIADVVVTLLFLFTLYQLERLFYSYQKQVFYARKNNTRLCNIGITLVIIALLQPLRDVLLYFLSRDINVPEPLKDYMVDFTLTFDFPLLLIGLALIAIASVLSDALRLQEEADLTI